MPKRLSRLTVGFMNRLLAPHRVHARAIKESPPPPKEPQKCANPDCEQPATNAPYCSADCCKAHRQNYKAVGGRNVRIDRAE